MITTAAPDFATLFPTGGRLAGLSSGDKTLLKNRKPNAFQGRLLTGASFGFSFFGFFTSFF